MCLGKEHDREIALPAAPWMCSYCRGPRRNISSIRVANERQKGPVG